MVSPNTCFSFLVRAWPWTADHGRSAIPGHTLADWNLVSGETWHHEGKAYLDFLVCENITSIWLSSLVTTLFWFPYITEFHRRETMAPMALPSETSKPQELLHRTLDRCCSSEAQQGLHVLLPNKPFSFIKDCSIWRDLSTSPSTLKF